MKRREFITLIGSTAASWPLAARAEQSVMPLVGFQHPGLSTSSAYAVAAFHRGLKECGFVEGRNVAIEYRWAEGQYNRLPEFAADLVRRQVAVIVAGGGVWSGLTAKRATSIIPIVFVGTADPVKLGLVSSFSQPGGNVTGIAMLSVELMAKRLELLHQLIPNGVTIGALVNPSNPIAEAETRDVEKAASSLGRVVIISKASSESQLEASFLSFVEQRVGALLVVSDALFNSERTKIAALAARHAMPAIYEIREFIEAGGLMSYGASFVDGYRRAGVYTGRILNGEKPAGLPVQQSVKVELVLNLKAAKALGLSFPITLLARADEVIE
jgi:putative tryptophan/tyrosine transport system substrate-binding protein